MSAEKSIVHRPVESYFDEFCSATSCKDILTAFYRLCDAASVKSFPGNHWFFTELRERLAFYWKAEALFSHLNHRVGNIVYENQRACQDIQVLVVGCGPCGLRSAIELAILGAHVVVIEKRTEFSRNNVLHLWPYLISDLKSLGAKTFFGKFCAGSIDHISIRTLQCILLKAALLFGVQIETGVTFQKLREPSDTYDSSVSAECSNPGPFSLFQGSGRASYGWRGQFSPPNQSLSAFEFNVIIDAAGKSYSGLNFPRKALRCRLAIAITVNFVNHGNAEDAHVEEISGVASIFNQPFFGQISSRLGLDLENLVYYKDETHYFVMTIKKKSLLSKGVLICDFDDPAKLLCPDNIDPAALQLVARAVATFATRGRLTRLEFALNCHGKPDIAVFDFTSLSAAEYACRISDRGGRPLCQCLVGDALVEPFWPRGSGCALGFLSALDAAWAVSLFAAGNHPLRVLAWRDSLYQRLSQTSPSNMPPNFAAYSLHPTSRYTLVDLELVQPMQVLRLYDCDVIARMSERDAFTFLRDSVKSHNHQRLLPSANVTVKPTPPVSLLRWFQLRLAPYPTFICPDIVDLSSQNWSDGRALACLVHKYRPDLVSFEDLTTGRSDGAQWAIDLLATHFDAPLAVGCGGWPEYLSVLCERLETHNPAFTVSRTERGHLKRSISLGRNHSSHPPQRGSSSRHIDPLASPRVPLNRLTSRPLNIRKLQHNLTKPIEPPSQPRRDISSSVEKGLLSRRRSEFMALLNDPASAIRRRLTIDCEKAFDNNCLPSFKDLPCSSSLQLRQGATNRQTNQQTTSPISSAISTASWKPRGADVCVVCKQRIYAVESVSYDRFRLHPRCFRCAQCGRLLRPETAHLLYRDNNATLYCSNHFHEQKTFKRSFESNMADRRLSKSTPRAHNRTPSLFYGLVGQSSNPARSHTGDEPSNVGRPSSQGVCTTAMNVPQPPVSPCRQPPGVGRLAIRDEPAPPVLLTSRSLSGTLGMSECNRRAAFDARLYQSLGYVPPAIPCHRLSDLTSQRLPEADEGHFASSEQDESSSTSSSNNNDSPPPMNMAAATEFCRSNALYRHNHPQDNPSSDEEELASESNFSEPEITDTFDTLQEVSEYENVRWTLAKPPPSPPLVPPTNVVSTPTAESSPLVKKYGLSASLLAAKERFCIEIPKPVRIDSRVFRASKNMERAQENSLPDCSEGVEFLPDVVYLYALSTKVISIKEDSIIVSPSVDPFMAISPISLVSRPESATSTVQLPNPPSLLSRLNPITSSVESNIANVNGITRESLDPLNSVAEDPQQPITAWCSNASEVSVTPSIPTKVHDESSTISHVSDIGPFRLPDQGIFHQIPKTDTLDSTVVSDYGYEITPKLCSIQPFDSSSLLSEATLTTSSSEEEEEEEEEVVMVEEEEEKMVMEESNENTDSLQHPVPCPPTGLITQQKNTFEKASQRVPLYILTSRLDSDDNHEHVSDLQDELEDEEDTSESSSDEVAVAVSDLQKGQISALKNRLVQLEQKMHALEEQSAEKECLLRRFEEEYSGPLREASSINLSTSEPNLTKSGLPAESTTANTRYKKISRLRWFRPRQPSTALQKTNFVYPLKIDQQMIERPDRAQLLTDLLAVVSERNRLLTEEAVLVAELKKIQMEAYGNALKMTYDSIQSTDTPTHTPEQQHTPGLFKRTGASRFARNAVFSGKQQNRKKLLVKEMSRVSKEQATLTALQSETMKCTNLQELSANRVISRKLQAARPPADLPSHQHITPSIHGH